MLELHRGTVRQQQCVAQLVVQRAVPSRLLWSHHWTEPSNVQWSLPCWLLLRCGIAELHDCEMQSRTVQYAGLERLPELFGGVLLWIWVTISDSADVHPRHVQCGRIVSVH